MTGYTRQAQADIQDGMDILAEPLNEEFDAITVAFNGSNGHTHDGSAGSGPKINLATSVVGVLPLTSIAASAFGRTLIDDADSTEGRATLGAQQSLTNTDNIRLGYALTGTRNTNIDFHVVDGTAFQARIVRLSGLNGVMSINQTGTGALQLGHSGTGAIQLDGGSDIFRNGGKIWHAGNDGPGSGLDADTVDGIQGSSIVQNNGGTYSINISGAAAYAAGAGNSINLNNQPATYYTDIPARLGYTPLDTNNPQVNTSLKITSNAPFLEFRETDVAGGASWFWIMDGVSLTSRYQTFDNIFLNMQPTGVFTWQGNTIWHRGNDGAGSGLDADLLDGQDGGYYTNIPSRLGYTPANKNGDTFTNSIGVGGFTPGGTFNNNKAIAIGDTDSGIRSGGDGIIELWTNGVSRLVVNNGSFAFTTTGFSVNGADPVYNNGGTYGINITGSAVQANNASNLNSQPSSFYTDIPARLGYTPANNGITIIAGNGLTGGGNLTGNVTINVGTPTSISNSSTNSVGADDHGHALAFLAAEVHTGNVNTTLDFPVGHTVLVNVNGTTPPARNAFASIYLSTTNFGYQLTANGTALSGTWRSRGALANDTALFQKVTI